MWAQLLCVALFLGAFAQSAPAALRAKVRIPQEEEEEEEVTVRLAG